MNPDLQEAGTLVSATLAAAEIDRASLPQRGDAHPVKNCDNCGTALHGAYCQACGQAAHLHHSLLHLTEEVLHGVLHFDAKGWRTLPLLIARPGLLTRRYIDGQRTRYVSPLALFLFTVFLMFFVFSLTGGGAPSTRVTATQSAEAKAELAQEVAEGDSDIARATAALARARRTGADAAEARADLAAAQASQRIVEMTERTVDATLAGAAHAAPDTWKAQLAGLNVHTGSAALDAKLHRALGNPDLFLYEFKNTAYKFSFMLIPISLPFLWLMFIGKPGVAVYDHAVFSLYSLSFMSLLFVTAALLGAIGMDSTVASMVIAVPPLHMFVQLRETYLLGVFASVWRTIVLLCVAGTAFCLFLFFIVMLILR
jgi:hypothetical protein